MNTAIIEALSDEADNYADRVLQMPGEYHPDWHIVRDTRFYKEAFNEGIKKAIDAIRDRHSGDIYLYKYISTISGEKLTWEE